MVSHCWSVFGLVVGVSHVVVLRVLLWQSSLVMLRSVVVWRDWKGEVRYVVLGNGDAVKGRL